VKRQLAGLGAAAVLACLLAVVVNLVRMDTLLGGVAPDVEAGGTPEPATSSVPNGNFSSDTDHWTKIQGNGTLEADTLTFPESSGPGEAGDCRYGSRLQFTGTAGKLVPSLDTYFESDEFTVPPLTPWLGSTFWTSRPDRSWVA
jgi:hypothetical protein